MKAQVCPVCNGTQRVPAGFYNHGISTTAASPEICRSCSGKGILMIPEENDKVYEFNITGAELLKESLPVMKENAAVYTRGFALQILRKHLDKSALAYDEEEGWINGYVDFNIFIDAMLEFRSPNINSEEK